PPLSSHYSLNTRDLTIIPTRRSSDLIANAEYNSRTFAENLMVDLEDEISDLNDALEGFDLGFKGALANGVLDMIERSHISDALIDRKSTRLNSSHVSISYAVFCLKKK